MGTKFSKELKLVKMDAGRVVFFVMGLQWLNLAKIGVMGFIREVVGFKVLLETVVPTLVLVNILWVN